MLLLYDFGNFIICDTKDYFVMSINAISSVSLYEYYYTINQEDKKKKSSPIAKEMKEYGLRPTDDEELNIAMLKRAKQLEAQGVQKSKEPDPANRPWADLMYQLGLSFNPDPKDDIQDIKDELSKLTKGVSDDELDSEVKDLESYVENLYLKFVQNSPNSMDSSTTLSTQLNNLSMLNQVNLM